MKKILYLFIIIYPLFLSAQSSVAYYNKGVDKINLKDDNGAIADFTKAIKIDPNYTKAYYNRGRSKHKLKDFNGAIADYNKAIKLDPNYTEAYYNRGRLKYKLRDYFGAMSDYTKAIRIDPADALWLVTKEVVGSTI